MEQNTVVFLVQLVFTLAAIIAIVLVVVRPLWRMLQTKPDLELLDPWSHQADSSIGKELEIPTTGDSDIPDRSKIIDLAKKDPTVTANTISWWIREKN